MWLTRWPPPCVTITCENVQHERQSRGKMITKITGSLNRVLDEEVRVQVGPLEYQVLVPEFVRRPLQGRVGQEVTLHTSEYFDGNPMQGRVVPRMLGFSHEAELEFFELFCTVDKVGTRKAIKALVRPIKEIADAIQRQDAKWLTTLPGVGAATAEQIVATLRRKVTKFALMAPPSEAGDGAAAVSSVDGNLLEDAYKALLSVGLSPFEARQRLDRALTDGGKFDSVEEILLEIYKHR
jgi:Holliday junction DNA helicase RuvA